MAIENIGFIFQWPFMVIYLTFWTMYALTYPIIGEFNSFESKVISIYYYPVVRTS